MCSESDSAATVERLTPTDPSRSLLRETSGHSGCSSGRCACSMENSPGAATEKAVATAELAVVTQMKAMHSILMIVSTEHLNWRFALQVTPMLMVSNH